MSLRLDPKYHGVRVARVRPKDTALIVTPGLSMDFGKLIIPKLGHLKFVRGNKGAIMPGIQDWRPALTAGRVRNAYFASQKSALEALGLR